MQLQNTQSSVPSSYTSSSMFEKTSFSPDGARELAAITPDGRLLLWDALPNSRIPKKEYVPSAHLTAAPTCLVWIRSRPKKPSRKRKMMNGFGSEETDDHHGKSWDMIAMGTSGGTIMLYSVKVGDVVGVLELDTEDSSSEVTCLASSEDSGDSGGDSDEIFAATNEGLVCQFKKSKLVSKFVTKKSERLRSILLVPNKKNGKGIIVASSRITWWDLKTKTLLRTFRGHKGEVTSLILLIEKNYFASASINDQAVNVWSLQEEEEEEAKDPLTLSVNEPVKSVNSFSKEDEKTVVINVITQSGTLKSYELNFKKSRKSLKPKSTLQIASEKEETSSSSKVSIIPIHACSYAGKSLVLAYGHLQIHFENIIYEDLQKTTCLVRKESVNPQKPGYVSTLQVPDTSNAVVLRGNAFNKVKRKSNASKDEYLPFIERLQLLSKDENPKTTPPRTDSLLHLLLQGLHNQDAKILDSVLDRADEELIDNTVKKLPIEGIIPLIEELQRYIRGRGMVNQAHAKWLRSVLVNHTAYLVSTPNSEELLGPITTMLEARSRNYSALMQLKGKLDIIAKQITGKADELSTSSFGVDKNALLVYQDESPDESVLDELLLPASDTDDNLEDEDEDENDEEEEEEDEEEDEESSDVELVNGDEEDQMEAD